MAAAEPQSGHAATDRALEALLWLCIAGACLMRFVGLGHLPGINGDEAYLGTKVVLFMRGEEISLLTGTNLPPDPLSFLLSMGVHAVGPISFVSLRLPSALSGVLAVILSFVLFRRLWGTGAALCIAALVAALPVHVGYSRFFWEPSQTPLACTVALYAAYRRNAWLALSATALLVWVHPTNVFALPVLAAPFVPGLAERFSVAAQRVRDRDRRALLLLASAFAVIVLAAWQVGRNVRLGGLLGAAAVRATSPKAMGLFVERWAGLLDGSTLYTYITGPLPEGMAMAHHLAFALLFALPVAAALLRCHHRDLRCMAAGLGLALPLFYLFAGPEAIRPNSERYAMWMTVPHCVLLGLALSGLARELARPRLAPVAAALLSVAMLLSFQHGYLRRLELYNSQSERTFMTGEVEPKRAAFERILELREPARRTRILTEDWWTYWAFAYQSLAHEGIEVGIPGKRWDRRFPRDFELPQTTPEQTQTFAVGYVGGPLSQQTRDRSHRGGGRGEIEVIGGYGSLPILEVRLEPAERAQR